MDGIEDRILRLEQRLRHAEDKLAIYQLLAGYGPAIDGDCQSDAARAWIEDSVYDMDEKRFEGRANILAMLEGDYARGLIKSGSGHVISMPHIVVDGDTAVATCTSRLYRHAEGNFRVERVTANRWELVRTPQGWRVKRRTNRTLDGSKGSHALFKQAAGNNLVDT